MIKVCSLHRDIQQGE